MGRDWMLVRSIGIEPMTYRLGGGCSILLSYERIKSCHISNFLSIIQFFR